MTPNEQAELRRILTTLSGLIKQLSPEEIEGNELALDPKRQHQAIRMAGTTVLAFNLCRRAIELCDLMPHPTGLQRTRHPGKKSATRGAVGAYILRRLEGGPMRRPVLARDCVQGGFCTAETTSYGAIQKLLRDGKIKFDQHENTVSLVRQNVNSAPPVEVQT